MGTLRCVYWYPFGILHELSISCWSFGLFVLFRTTSLQTNPMAWKNSISGTGKQMHKTQASVQGSFVKTDRLLAQSSKDC